MLKDVLVDQTARQPMASVSYVCFLSLPFCLFAQAFFFSPLRSSKAVAVHLFTKGKYSVFISFCVIAALHKCLTACIVPEWLQTGESLKRAPTGETWKDLTSAETVKLSESLLSEVMQAAAVEMVLLLRWLRSHEGIRRAGEKLPNRLSTGNWPQRFSGANLFMNGRLRVHTLFHLPFPRLHMRSAGPNVSSCSVDGFYDDGLIISWVFIIFFFPTWLLWLKLLFAGSFCSGGSCRFKQRD